MYIKIAKAVAVNTFLMVIAVSVFGQNKYLKLWYNAPAGSVWEKALPLGNGRLACMVYGNPEKEVIQLNEATLWSGGPNRNDSKSSLAALPEVRKLIFEDKRKEAADLASKEIKSEKINGMCYQTVGNLNLSFPSHEHYENYYRDLDLERAVATTTYTVDGVTYKREVFSSKPDQVMIVHLTASKKASITLSASMFSPQKSTIITKGKDELVLSGISGDKDGIKGQDKFQPW